jgi:hypothetical protein
MWEVEVEGLGPRPTPGKSERSYLKSKVK